MYMCRSLALGCFAQLPRFVCIFWATTSSIIEWRWIQAWCIVQNRPQSMLLTYANLSGLLGGCITLSSYFLLSSTNCHWPMLMCMILVIPPSHRVNQWNSAQTSNPGIYHLNNCQYDVLKNINDHLFISFNTASYSLMSLSLILCPSTRLDVLQTLIQHLVQLHQRHRILCACHNKSSAIRQKDWLGNILNFRINQLQS